MRTQRAFNYRPILLGCLGASIMGVLSCCALVAVALSPALDGSLPPRPAPDPNQEDITIIVREAYLNRVMSESLPGPMKDAATLDVQPGGLLVVTTSVDLVLQELEVTVTLRMDVEDGELQLALESVEAGGEDILDLLGVDREALGEAMSEAIQGQVEAGLGEGAQILGITMDEEHIIITARWTV
ncbi:MAG: DUF2993 domain-containing protein [Anaerolineae bacterium]|jgi:hypothetical protein